jgi:hypothetical protein
LHRTGSKGGNPNLWKTRFVILDKNKKHRVNETNRITL